MLKSVDQHASSFPDLESGGVSPHDNPRGEGWTAIVLAGTRPGHDKLARHFGLTNKSSVMLAGRSLLDRVLQSLAQIHSFRRIIVLAQDHEKLMAEPGLGWARQDPRIISIKSNESICLSLLEVTRNERFHFPMLITTADNALLQPSTVESFIRASDKCDVAIGMVSRDILSGAFPHSKRTWMHFRDGAYTGANLFALKSVQTEKALQFWRSVEAERKKVYRLATRFGPGLFIRSLLRSLTAEQTIAQAGEKLRVHAKPVFLPVATAGIDIDKLDDFHLAEKILRGENWAETRGRP